MKRHSVFSYDLMCGFEKFIHLTNSIRKYIKYITKGIWMHHGDHVAPGSNFLDLKNWIAKFLWMFLQNKIEEKKPIILVLPAHIFNSTIDTTNRQSTVDEKCIPLDVPKQKYNFQCVYKCSKETCKIAFTHGWTIIIFAMKKNHVT